MKKLFLVIALVVVVAVSGCTNPQTSGEIKYGNDILTVGEFYVSDRTPYEGETVVMEMILQNNGEYTIPNSEINFKTPGFEILEISCDGSNNYIIGDQNDAKCKFSGDSKIESLDYRMVILKMRVKDIGILTEKVYTVNYNIKYDYSGFRSMNIPIIDGVTVKTPSSKYSQSAETYGPIKLSFELPETGQTTEDGKTIYQYWGVRNNPFKVKFMFRHVGSSSIGEIKDPVIEKGDVVLDSRGSLKIASFGGSNFYCNFEEKSGALSSTKEIELPGELVCSFQSTQSWDTDSNPETYASLWVSYDYTYEYSRSYDFTIEPNPTSSHDDYASESAPSSDETAKSKPIFGEQTKSP